MQKVNLRPNKQPSGNLEIMQNRLTPMKAFTTSFRGVWGELNKSGCHQPVNRICFGC